MNEGGAPVSCRAALDVSGCSVGPRDPPWPSPAVPGASDALCCRPRSPGQGRERRWWRGAARPNCSVGRNRSETRRPPPGTMRHQPQHRASPNDVLDTSKEPHDQRRPDVGARSDCRPGCVRSDQPRPPPPSPPTSPRASPHPAAPPRRGAEGAGAGPAPHEGADVALPRSSEPGFVARSAALTWRHMARRGLEDSGFHHCDTLTMSAQLSCERGQDHPMSGSGGPRLPPVRGGGGEGLQPSATGEGSACGAQLSPRSWTS